MSIPVLVLLGFAGWTLFLMIVTVGTYRWFHVLTGRKPIAEFGKYKIEGEGWYKRAMRAHANCVENLPVYGAIVLVLVVGEIHAPILDVLAITFMSLRILHSSVHVAFDHSNITTGMRSGLFIAQLVCMIWMGTYAAVEIV